jgi:hypothetical protein
LVCCPNTEQLTPQLRRKNGGVHGTSHERDHNRVMRLVHRLPCISLLPSAPRPFQPSAEFPFHQHSANRKPFAKFIQMPSPIFPSIREPKLRKLRAGQRLPIMYPPRDGPSTMLVLRNKHTRYRLHRQGLGKLARCGPVRQWSVGRYSTIIHHPLRKVNPLNPRYSLDTPPITPRYRGR